MFRVAERMTVNGSSRFYVTVAVADQSLCFTTDSREEARKRGKEEHLRLCTEIHGRIVLASEIKQRIQELGISMRQAAFICRKNYPAFTSMLKYDGKTRYNKVARLFGDSVKIPQGEQYSMQQKFAGSLCRSDKAKEARFWAKKIRSHIEFLPQAWMKDVEGCLRRLDKWSEGNHAESV